MLHQGYSEVTLACSFSSAGAVVHNSMTTSTIWCQGTSTFTHHYFAPSMQMSTQQITISVTVRTYFRGSQGPTDHTLKNRCL